MEEQIVSMRVVTPGKGTLTLSRPEPGADGPRERVPVRVTQRKTLLLERVAENAPQGSFCALVWF